MTTLKAEKRSMDVKAKRLRREGYVTGNVFGKKIQGSIPVKMEKKDVDRLLKPETKGGQIMLDVEGEVYDVLIKEVDYDAMANQVVEIDFQALVSNEMVHSVAEIILENEEMVVSGVLQDELKEVAYKALPKDLVEKVEIDCSELHVGDTLKVSDLAIAKNGNIDITTHLDTPVLNVIVARSAEDDEDAAEEDAAEEAK